MEYKAIGNKIISYDEYDQFDVAICNEPDKAIKLMNRGHYLNDVKRQYKNSARVFYEVEQLPGFKWIIPVK